MTKLTQNIILHKLDGTTETTTTTHIYAETGHLIDKTSHVCGWHIQLGTADSEDNYTEETGTEQHDVPASLPDVDIYEEDTPPTDEEYIEAAKIMMGEV